MDSPSDFIKILVLVGIIVVSIVQKVKKQAIPQKTSVPNPHSENFPTFPPLETISREQDIDDEYEYEFEMRPQPIGKVELDYFEKKAKNYRNVEMDEHKKVHHLNQLEVFESFEGAPEKQQRVDIQLKNPNTARQAFIYSEIFNRKY